MQSSLRGMLLNSPAESLPTLTFSHNAFHMDLCFLMSFQKALQGVQWELPKQN